MSSRVVSRFSDRFDDRLLAIPGGFVSASAYSLTRWSDLHPAETLTSTEPIRGPLAWLSELNTLAWGPVVLSGDKPRWSVARLAEIVLADIGEGAPRVYDPLNGTVSGDGEQVFVSFQRRLPRTRGVKVAESDGGEIGDGPKGD